MSLMLLGCMLKGRESGEYYVYFTTWKKNKLQRKEDEVSSHLYVTIY